MKGLTEACWRELHLQVRLHALEGAAARRRMVCCPKACRYCSTCARACLTSGGSTLAASRTAGSPVPADMTVMAAGNQSGWAAVQSPPAAVTMSLPQGSIGGSTP